MHRLAASTLGLGLVPGRLAGTDAGAGTLGAIAAIPLALATRPLGVAAQVGLMVVLVVVGLWAARPFTAGGADPGWIVIDETAGALLAVVGLGGWPFVAGWAVARLADIFKVLPGVGRAERLPGAVGVMADDLLAGLYGLAAGWALHGLLGG